MHPSISVALHTRTRAHTTLQVLRRGEGRTARANPDRHGGVLPVGGQAHLRRLRRSSSRLLRPGRALHHPQHGQPQPLPGAVPNILEGEA